MEEKHCGKMGKYFCLKRRETLGQKVNKWEKMGNFAEIWLNIWKDRGNIAEKWVKDKDRGNVAEKWLNYLKGSKI